MNQSEFDVYTCMIGFTPDWMKKWRKIFEPIVWRRKCKTSYCRESNYKVGPGEGAGMLSI